MQRLNCLPCRRRKSKCDRAEPCLSCVLRGTEAYCYTDLEPPAPQSRQAANTSSTSGASSGSTHDADGAGSTKKQHRASNGDSATTGRGQPSSPSVHYNNIQDSDRSEGSSSRTRLTEAAAAPEGQNAQTSIHRTLDTLEAGLREVRRSVQASPRQAGLSSWGTLVPWHEARNLFPEPDETSAIFHCFFTELRWYMSSVDQEEFETMWARAEKGKEDLPRHRVALMSAVMAFSLLLAPRAHPASRLPPKSTTDARWHIENARMLIDAHYQASTHAEEDDEDTAWKRLGSQDEMIGQLEAETVYCYYCAVAGLVRKSFFALGRAIRLGLATHLFDETRWKTSTTAEVEQRRCIAWDLIVVDRWTAGHLGIQSNFPTQPRVKYTTRDAGKQTVQRNKMTGLVARIVTYTNTMGNAPMHARVEQAEALGRDLQQYYDEMPQELQFDRLTQISTFDSSAARVASQSLSFYLSYLFVQAMRVRPFLMDPAAPPQMRFASLQYARKIIELRPQLIAMTHNPWTSHPPSWSLQFIFIASTIFASVLLSRDSAISGSPSEGCGATVAAAHASPSFWPDADLDWFSEVIFDVVETFDLLAQGAKTNTARTCKKLFVGLCSSRDTLRKRFQQRERERLQQARGIRMEQRRERIAQNVTSTKTNGKRGRDDSASAAEEQAREQQRRDGNVALAYTDPFRIKKEGKTAFCNSPAHDNTAWSKESRSALVTSSGVEDGATADSTTMAVPNGLPNLYDTSTLQPVSQGSSLYMPQAPVTSLPATSLPDYGNHFGYTTGNDPFSGLPMFANEGATVGSDLSTPPDFANSALDMIYLDPLEWAQLTAGLDSGMPM